MRAKREGPRESKNIFWYPHGGIMSFLRRRQNVLDRARLGHRAMLYRLNSVPL